MSELEITPRILNLDNKSLDSLNVQQNYLNNDKNRLFYNDDNTSSNTHKISERNTGTSKSEKSLE